MNILSLLAQHGITAKQVSSIHGGEYHSPCPGCGGKDRFHCWPQRESTGSCTVPGVWGCRQCDASGDMIAFLTRYEGLGFKEACARLNVNIRHDGPVRLSTASRTHFTPQASSLPPALWQEKNTKLVQHAHSTLLETPTMLAWLAARGITDVSVRRFMLGYLPGERGTAWYTRPLSAWGLPVGSDGKQVFCFPRGLCIPRFSGSGVVTALRIRRNNEDVKENDKIAKYLAFRGAKALPLLVMPKGFSPELITVVVVESELDAILIAEIAAANNLPIGALAVLSNCGKPDATTHAVLRHVARILVAMDFDAAGDKGLAWWLETYNTAQDWPVPEGKDPGEAFALGVDMPMWLRAGLPQLHSGSLALHIAQEGGLTTPAADAVAQGGGGAKPSVPAGVLGLRAWMQRFAFITIHVTDNPYSFGLKAPVRWRQENWDTYTTISKLALGAEVQRWLDAHPIQNGIIDQYNLIVGE